MFSLDLQVLNSTARTRYNFPAKFPSKPRLSRISRVETVFSFNHEEGKTKSKGDDVRNMQAEDNYTKLQKELKDLQAKMNEVKLNLLLIHK